MNSLLSRSNALFAFTLSVLAFMTALCALSTAFKSYGETVEVQLATGSKAVRRVRNFSSHKKELNDLGFVTFDMIADFTKTFDWNTKQLFLFLTASYASENNINNEVILWDKIITRDDNKIINLKNHNTKYYFWDDGFGLRANPNVTLTLSMNIIPNAGLLTVFQTRNTHRFSFPNEYMAVDA